MTAGNKSHPCISTPVGRGAIGVITRGETMLMIRRAAGIAKGGFWCFPGGHVEPGETPRQAVRRELAEELGIEVTPIERVGAVRVRDPRYVLVVWRVRHTKGDFRLARKEVAELRWLTPTEVRNLDQGLESNQTVLEMLGV